MTNLRSLPLCALAGALLSCSAMAQAATAKVRIVSPIDETHLSTLRGSLNPAAIGAIDRGAVSADLPMVLTMVLSRSADEQAAFDTFVASQYDQSSPNFHQWLSPQQVGQRFGPAQADINTLSSWLAGHGFAIRSIGADGMTIQFSGTAGQVESAFHTQIHNLSIKGKAHIANVSDPQVPAAIAPVIVGIKGLRNFVPHPLHHLGGKVHFDANAHGWVKQQTALSATHLTAGVFNKPAPASKPSFYMGNYNFGVEEDLAPYDFAKIYNLPSGWPTSNNGSGQTITIIGTSDITSADVTQFRSVFGLPAVPSFTITHNPIDGDPGICSGDTNICNDSDLDENSLDVEWSGAVAPGAKIVLVADAYNSQTNPTNDPIYDGAEWAIANASVPGSAVYGSRILSISYGECELLNGTASNVAYNNLWETAASAGIAVFVAAGDSGSASCDDGLDEYGNPYEAQYGLSVSGLASTPYNTAVGGTDFSWCQPTINQSTGEAQNCSSTNASTYWNTSNGSQYQSAKGYVPEIPWNDTCENPINAAFLDSVLTYYGATGVSSLPPEETCNFIYENSTTLLQINENYGYDPLLEYVDTVGGSGGASNCVVNDGADSSSCSSSIASTGSNYGNLTLSSDGWPSPNWQAQSGVTGTSGLTQRAIPDVSFFAGNGDLGSATLICVSNDDAKCTSISETSSDVANEAGNDTGGAEEIGGTSVGTPEMAGVMALINENAGAPQGNPNQELYTLAAKQTYSSCSAETVSNSSSCYFQDIDNGPSGYSTAQTNAMPCAASDRDLEGTALYEGDGEWAYAPQYEFYALASPNCNIVDSGDVVGTLSGFSAATGYDQASGLGSLNIANVVNASNTWTAVAGTNPNTTVSFSGVASSIESSQALSVTVSVSGSSGTPTGDVTLTATNTNSYSAVQTLSSGTTTFTVPANTFTSSGSPATLTAYYSGDSTYAANKTTTTLDVTYVPVDTISLNTISSPSTVAPGGTASTTATVSSSNGYAGTVTLNCVLTGEPNGATNLPSCTANGTITLTGSRTSGSTTLSVTTTPTTTTELRKPNGSKGLFGAGGGAVLAFLLFLGIPARRKSWRAMLGMVVLLVTLGSLVACSSGGSSGGSSTIAGTTAGTYTFTVTPVGQPAPTVTPAAQTFNVMVN